MVVWNIMNLARNQQINDSFLQYAVFIIKVSLELKQESITSDVLHALAALTATDNNNRLEVIGQGKMTSILIEILTTSLNTNPVHLK